MQLEIIQNEADKTNYFERLCGYLKARGVKTKEQLESRFDALCAAFAMDHNGHYDAAARKLTIEGDRK